MLPTICNMLNPPHFIAEKFVPIYQSFSSSSVSDKPQPLSFWQPLSTLFLRVSLFFSFKSPHMGISLVVKWLRLHILNPGGLVSIPVQGTSSHIPQLNVPIWQLKQIKLHPACPNKDQKCPVPQLRLDLAKQIFVKHFAIFIHLFYLVGLSGSTLPCSMQDLSL